LVLVLVRIQQTNIGVGIDGPTRCRVTIVTRFDVTMKVRDSVAENLEIHFDRIDNSFEGSPHVHHIPEKVALFLCTQLIRLADVSPTNQNTVSRDRLVCGEAEAADTEVSNRVSVFIQYGLRHDRGTERAILASH
jgi:hypothetical protein